MRHKVYYRPLKTKWQMTEYKLMKIMLEDIILNQGLGEVFPAKEKENGIYCATKLGGKKFWTMKELEYYFAKKNGELERIKDENLRDLWQ